MPVTLSAGCGSPSRRWKRLIPWYGPDDGGVMVTAPCPERLMVSLFEEGSL